MTGIAQRALEDTAVTVGELNEKVRETLTLGRPADAYEYSQALSAATSGFRDLAAAVADLDDD